MSKRKRVVNAIARANGAVAADLYDELSEVLTMELPNGRPLVPGIRADRDPLAQLGRSIARIAALRRNAAQAASARRGRYKVDPQEILEAVASEWGRSIQRQRRSATDVYRAVAKRNGVSAKTVERSVLRAR